MKYLIFFNFFFYSTLIHAQSYNLQSLFYDGLSRQYKIFVPNSYDGSSHFPIIFSFHGGGDTMDGMIAMNDFSTLAGSENFIAVYPQAAVDPLDGSNAWIHKAPTSHDDIFFIEAIIDNLSSEFLIDNDRVYACGYSEGGIFSYELACRLNDRIAAITSVSGNMLVDSFRDSYYGLGFCSPTHPTGILLIPGTNDFSPHALYNGLQPYYMSVQETTSYWAAHNNCDLEASVSTLPDVNPSDGSTVERYTWSTTSGCTYVEELKVIGGGHEWPGAFGNMDINATEEIWNFVSNYDLNGIIDCSNLSDLTNDEVYPKIIFYPNPANDKITLDSSFLVQEDYEIISLNGKSLIRGKLEPGRSQIEVSGLSRSIYILKIKNKHYRLIIN